MPGPKQVIHGPANLPTSGGCYLLVLELEDIKHLAVGRLGRISFEPGLYFYVGSAYGPGGLRARLGCHLLGSRRCHWHIDYLRRAAKPVALLLYPGAAQQVCLLSAELQSNAYFVMILGFGCTDCHCASHLYHSGHTLKTILPSLPSSPLHLVLTP